VPELVVEERLRLEICCEKVIELSSITPRSHTLVENTN